MGDQKLDQIPDGQKLHCPECSRVLGVDIFDEMWKANVLTIKYKDLFIWILGTDATKMRIACPGCGKLIEITGKTE